MVRAPGHHLAARLVEDDHLEDARSFLVEGEEVANLQFMGNGKGCLP